MLAMADSGANIHLAKQSSTTMAPVIIKITKQHGSQMGAQRMFTYSDTPANRPKKTS